MKLKKLLEESNAPGFKDRKFGDALPTLASVKAAYEAKQGKEPIAEGLKSNIAQKWADQSTIEKDLMEFVNMAMDASGEELVEDIHASLIKAAEYAMKKLRGRQLEKFNIKAWQDKFDKEGVTKGGIINNIKTNEAKHKVVQKKTILSSKKKKNVR